jgi:hypothetical protein
MHSKMLRFFKGYSRRLCYLVVKSGRTKAYSVMNMLKGERAEGSCINYIDVAY